MSTKKYHGSCHCQKVRYTVEADLSQGTGRCNCTYCTKTRNWSMIVKPETFELLSGADDLSDYSRAGKEAYSKSLSMPPYTNHHFFCKNCGVHSFGMGNIPEIGGAYVSVNVACLDDVNFEEVMQTPVRFMNGRENDWFSVPKFTAHM